MYIHASKSPLSIKSSILRATVGLTVVWLAGFGGIARGGVILTDYPRLTEHSASFSFNLDTASQVTLFWGSANGGTNPVAWQSSPPPNSYAAGNFTNQLTGLDTFRKYFFAFRAVAGGITNWTAPGAFRPQVQGLVYSTGFETSELFPFNPGDLNNQGGPLPWRVKAGSASVGTATTAHGAQAVQVTGGWVDLSCLATNPVLWVDAFYFNAGSTNPPMLPTNTTAASLFFSTASGLLALDGDGQGNGVFVQVLPTLPASRFLRVSLRLDYQAKHYDVWVDGVAQRTGLGFKDAAATRLCGTQIRTSQTGYIDDYSVSIWGLDADTDGDGLNDLDEAKFYGSYPLLADSTGSGLTDMQKVTAGLDPGDATSYFAVQMDTDTHGTPRVIVPTITGRQYTLQRIADLNGGAWTNVPTMSGFNGDGTAWTFSETNGAPASFYRGSVTLPGGAQTLIYPWLTNP